MMSESYKVSHRNQRLVATHTPTMNPPYQSCSLERKKKKTPKRGFQGVGTSFQGRLDVGGSPLCVKGRRFVCWGRLVVWGVAALCVGFCVCVFVCGCVRWSLLHATDRREMRKRDTQAVPPRGLFSPRARKLVEGCAGAVTKQLLSSFQQRFVVLLLRGGGGR